MQHAGIGAAGDDGPVSRKLRAAAAKFVEQLGLDFVFVHTLTRGAHGAAMPDIGNRCCPAQGIDFGFVLDQAHFVQCKP